MLRDAFDLAWSSGSPGVAPRVTSQAAGAVLFGIAAIIVSLRIVDQLATHHLRAHMEEIPAVAPPVPPFSSDKAATAIDWIDVEEPANESADDPK